MMIKTRLARLESKVATDGLSLAVRAWLGQALSPAEEKQAAIEAAQPLAPINWNHVSKEMQGWLRQ